MKIAWVTDSTASISKEEAAKKGIHIIPLNIVLGEQSFRDGEEITMGTFFEEVEKSGKNPFSSQPSTGFIVSMLEEIQKDYDVIIGIFLSSKLSGTFNNIRLSSEMLENDFPVYLIDSYASSYPLKRLIEEGQYLESKGFSPTEIVEQLEEKKKQAAVYILISELDYLHRGGRVSGSGLLIGTLLKIKPILHLVDGEIKVYDKVRGESKAARQLVEIMSEKKPTETTKVAIVHADCLDKALKWKEELENQFPNIQFEIEELSPVIATHGGKNAIGLMWL